MHVPWSRFGLPHHLLRPGSASRGSATLPFTANDRTLAGFVVAVVRAVPAQVSRANLTVIIISALVSIVLIVDAMRHPYSAIDLPIMNNLQQIHHEWFHEIFWTFGRLTSTEGAIAMWLLVLAVMAHARWWAPLITVLVVPAGGVINIAIEHLLVARTRPHLPELLRGSLNWDEGSFPSGHALGAVMLYGLLFAWSGRIRVPLLGLLLRIWCFVVIMMVCVGRVWQGAHWPTDVLSGISIGILSVVVLIIFERALRAAAAEQQ
jgi:membrane-associated phospholipid phosphatase